MVGSYVSVRVCSGNNIRRRCKEEHEEANQSTGNSSVRISSPVQKVFFFFPYRPISFFRPKHADILPIQSDSARIGENPSGSARIGVCRSRIGASRRRFEPRRRESGNPRGTTRHGRAVCGVPPASPRPAASDAGALGPEPRPCIPAFS